MRLPALLFLLALTAALPAQIVLTAADYFPVAGDTLRTNQADSASIASIDLLTPGADRAWDFGELTAEFEFSEPVVDVSGDTLFPNAELAVQTDVFNREYYAVIDGQLEIVGLQARFEALPEVQFEAPVDPFRTSRHAPLTFGDRFESNSTNVIRVIPDDLPSAVLSQFPDLISEVDTLRLTVDSERTDAVDAYGTLTLDGTTYEVLRERRAETLTTTAEAYNSFLGYLDVTNVLVDFDSTLASFLGESELMVTYFYWAADSKEPIAVVQVDPNDESEVRSIRYKRAAPISNTRDMPFAQGRITVYPNPAGDRFTFEAEGLGDGGPYTFSLFNVLGREVKSAQFRAPGGRIRQPIEAGDLPRGMYLYSLRNSVGRIVGTRRVLVGR